MVLYFADDDETHVTVLKSVNYYTSKSITNVFETSIFKMETSKDQNRLKTSQIIYLYNIYIYKIKSIRIYGIL